MASLKWPTSFIALLVVAQVALGQQQPHDCNEMVPGRTCMEPLLQLFEGELFITSEEKLNEICGEMDLSRSCMASFEKQCNVRNIQFTTTRVNDNLRRLCSDQNYRREYLKNVVCLQKTTGKCLGLLKPSTGLSDGGDVRAETSDDKARKALDEICRGMVDFVKCVRGDTKRQCDQQSSAFVSKYVINEVQLGHCDKKIYVIDDTGDVISHSPIIRSCWSIVAFCVLTLVSFKQLL